MLKSEQFYSGFRYKWYTQQNSSWRLEYPLKKTIKGLIQLTQFNEYIYIVAISSLLGIVSVQETFEWRILPVIIANWLAVGLTYVVHNI